MTKLTAGLTLTCTLLLAGCQSTAFQTSISTDWRDADTEELSVAVNESELGVNHHSARHKIVKGRFHIQDVQWRGEDGWPRVRLLLHDLSNSRVTFTATNEFNQPLESRIRKAFGQYPLSIGDQGQIANTLGEARIQRFRVNDANECVFVGQFTAPSNDLRAGAGQELGQIYLEGTYCSEPGGVLSQAAVESFVRGLSLRSGNTG